MNAINCGIELHQQVWIQNSIKPTQHFGAKEQTPEDVININKKMNFSKWADIKLTCFFFNK